MQVLIDSAKKNFTVWVFSIISGVCVTIWGVFIRPQIVMASDLQTVVDSVERLEQKVDQTATMVEKLASNQIRQQELYYEDQIRILEVTQSERPLSATETQRLLRLKADLRYLKEQ